MVSRRSPQSASFRLKSCCGLALLLLALLAAPVRAAEEDFTDGVGHYNKSRWKLAAESFRKFLKENPEHKNVERAQYYLGLTLINLDDHTAARDALRAFVAKYPASKNAVPAQYWMGQCSYLLRDNAAAAKELLAFLQKAPDDPLAERALSYLGESELELNQPEQAIGHLTQSLQKNGKGAAAEDTKYFLAKAYEVSKKLEQARPIYQELAASQTASHAADAQIRLGKIDFDAGQYQKSAEAYAAFEQRFPRSEKLPVARLNYGFAMFELNRHPEAIAAFDKVLADPKFGNEALYWKGQSQKATAAWDQAVATFKAGYEKTKGTPAGERFLFQMAYSEQRRGQLDVARTLFVELADAYPQGTYPDDSIHAATEAALLAGKYPEAEKLVARFDQQFAASPLKPAQDVLKGRLAFSSAKPGPEGDAQREIAIKALEAAVTAAAADPVGLQGRYYLGSALQTRAIQPGRTPDQSRQDHARVVEVTTPLADAVEKDASLRSMAGVYVVRGVSALSLGKRTPVDMASVKLQHFTLALQSANRYLALAEKGELADQALAVKVIAEAHSGQKDPAVLDLDRLRALAPNSRALDEALMEVGDVAFSVDDLPLAERMFAELATRTGPRLNPRALLELGHTRAKMKKHPEAAVAFGRMADEFPADPDAPEAAYLRGKMLEEAGNLVEAQKAYAATFAKYSPHDYGYLSGFANGVTLARMKKLDDAEKAFAETAAKYAGRKDLDRLLNEWAGVNYDHERYAKSDEVYARLVKDFPESKYVGAARMSLAESELMAERFDKARPLFLALAEDPKIEPRLQQRAYFQLMEVETAAVRWDDVRKVCQRYLERYPQGLYRLDAEFHMAEADFLKELFKESHDRLVKLRADLLALRNKPAVPAGAPVKPAGAAADTENGGIREDDPSSRRWYTRTWVLLGETQFRLKQYPEMEATAAEFRKLFPKSEDLYRVDETLGRTYKSQARFEEARQAFERVITSEHGRSTETAAKSHFHLAETYLLQKDYQHALAEYLKVEIRYDYPEWQGLGLFQAAACMEQLNDWKEAVKTYEDLIKNYPQHAYVPQAKERLAAARKKAG